MAGVKGKSGRIPKPNRIKRIMGVRKDRINEKEPALIVASPKVPDWGGALDETGQRIFDYYSKMLFANGTAGQSDESGLMQLAYTAQEWLREKKLCDRKGRNMPIKNKNGEVIGTTITSWAKNERELHRDYVKLLREYGCTPLSRGAIVRISKGEDALTIPQIT